jgi:AraC-like DNA-binding protein
MALVRPPEVLAGFHAEAPAPDVPELVHAGEQWAPPELLIGPHEHDDAWELYLQVHGVSHWADAAGRPHALRPRAFFAAPPGSRHGMTRRPSARHHFLYAALRLDPVLARHPALRPAWEPPRPHAVPGAASLEMPFRALVREVAVALPFRAEGLRAALDGLAVEATRLVAGAAGGTALAPAHPAVERARALLDEHYAQPWTLAALARAAHVSPTYLADLFTRDLGVPPHRYLLDRRIERARELLAHTDLSVTRTAYELGFSSPQHLARAFRAREGRSPREHRRAARAGGA